MKIGQTPLRFRQSRSPPPKRDRRTVTSQIGRHNFAPEQARTTLDPIHPQALISPEARLGRDVSVGPFSIVEHGVKIGDGCRLASHVVIKEGTELGKYNTVGEHAVIGGLPQHVKTPDQPGGLQVGDHNTIREHATLHRSLYTNQSTRVGDNNMLMVGVHVAHDCIIGNQTILTNNLLLAGHVEVGDHAYLSGIVGIHQFCRIGRYAMVGGFSKIVKDVPPYVMACGADAHVVGLNKVGLRRKGFTRQQIAQIKEAYRLIFRSGLPWNEMLRTLKEEFSGEPAAEFHRFLTGGRRGFLQEKQSPTVASVRLHRAEELPPLPRRRAG